MKICEVKTTFSKWEQSNTLFHGNLKDGERVAFSVQHPVPYPDKVYFVSANIYITNIATDFILDINLTSQVKLNSVVPGPIAEEFYHAYLAARLDWNRQIKFTSIGHGILIDRSATYPLPFAHVRPQIDQVLQHYFTTDES